MCLPLFLDSGSKPYSFRRAALFCGVSSLRSIVSLGFRVLSVVTNAFAFVSSALSLMGWLISHFELSPGLHSFAATSTQLSVIGVWDFWAPPPKREMD